MHGKMGLALLRMALLPPMVDWQEMAERWIARAPGKGLLPPVEERISIQEAVNDLDGMIVQLSRFREYLEQRGGTGCGDQGHKSAVKAQNKMAAAIRRALGFTRAKSDVIF